VVVQIMTKAKELKLRCYVCGKSIDLSGFALVSMSTFEVDRAFVVHSERCLAQVEDDSQSILVCRRAGKSKEIE
jgi:hypothetical protein